MIEFIHEDGWRGFHVFDRTFLVRGEGVERIVRVITCFGLYSLATTVWKQISSSSSSSSGGVSSSWLTRSVDAVSNRLVAALSNLSEKCIPLIHYGLVPDFVIRFGIRVQLKHHLQLLASDTVEEEMAKKLEIVESLRSMPIAIETKAANDQHYEVPAEFYDLCLVRDYWVVVLEL